MFQKPLDKYKIYILHKSFISTPDKDLKHLSSFHGLWNTCRISYSVRFFFKYIIKYVYFSLQLINAIAIKTIYLQRLLKARIIAIFVRKRIPYINTIYGSIRVFSGCQQCPVQILLRRTNPHSKRKAQRIRRAGKWKQSRIITAFKIISGKFIRNIKSYLSI